MLTTKNILSALALLLALNGAAQPPRISYQTIVRNAQGQPAANTHVALRYTIHDGAPTGTIAWQETHAQTTNAFGLFTAVLGTGGGDLTTVRWDSATKYLEVEASIAGAPYVAMGTTELVSVPYALYAGSTRPLYTVRIDGTDITDMGHVATGFYGSYAICMTATGYYYSINRGPNTLQTFTRGVGVIFADDTINGPWYIATPKYPCGNTLAYPVEGMITAANTNTTSALYYIPMNAPPAATPRYYLYTPCDHWSANSNWGSQYTFYQLVPNNAAVTGFGVALPCTVSITR